MKTARRARRALAIALLTAAVPAVATAQGLPEPLRGVDFEQRLGNQVPLDLEFKDHTGRERELGEFFGERPVILALVYYECPMLCTMILNGLTSSLRILGFEAGDEYELVVASFDPREGPAEAARTRAVHLERLGGPPSQPGWNFLTGDPEPISELAESVGFRYTFDEDSGEFAHTAGIVVLTPDGRVSRYFLGVEYPARYLRLGLIESASGTVGTLVDRVLLFCFRYDPQTARYSAAVMNLVRLSAFATVFVVGILVTASLRRERRVREV